MSVDPGEAFLDGLEAALRGSTALAAAMALSEPRVFTERPTNAAYPYVLIGDDQVLGVEHDESEDDCAVPTEIVSTLHVYAQTASGVKGSRRARRIAGALRALLVAGFDVDGHVMSLAGFDDYRPLTDPVTGATHVVLTFSFRTTPEAA